MRSLVTALIVALLLPTAAEARKPRCTLRVHAEANPNDGPVFSSSVPSSRTGKKVVIAKAPVVSELDVAGYAVYPAANGTFGVLFQLNDHGKLALDTLSVEKRGTYVYVFVNGRGVSELQIDKRVTDGQLYLASGLTAQDIELMKKSWPTKSSANRRPRR